MSIVGKLSGLLVVTALTTATVTVSLSHYISHPALKIAGALALTLLPMIWIAKIVSRPVHDMLRALSALIDNYRDGDFNSSLAVDRNDEFGALLKVHNELGEVLRKQRSQLVQRERLLDTVTQNSPVALVLVDAHQRIAYDNIAARHLLHAGRSMTGQHFENILQEGPESLRLAIATTTDKLFSVPMHGTDETFHLSQRIFELQGRPYRLYLFKHLTQELSRQEVGTWKKLIRVLSHELNNSLAPIASLAHSGIELMRRGETDELAGILATIGERAEHLHHFITSYAEFARLPAPQPETIDWNLLIDEVTRAQRVCIVGVLPAQPGWADRSQLAQALLNLIRNAHEAGGPPDSIEIAISCVGKEQRIDVRDRGPGMSEAVLTQALLPFYSTKRDGTGLGLALAREIVDAHGGQIQLANRENGGLCVTLILPLA